MSDKSVDVVLVGPNAGKDRHFFGVAFRGGRGVVPPGDNQATVLRVLREDFGAVAAPESEPEPTLLLVPSEDEEDDLLGCGKDEDEKDKSKATTKRIKRNR